MNRQHLHRIICPPSFHPCGEGRRVVVTEHVITVPFVQNDETKGDDTDDIAENSAMMDQGETTPSTIDVYFSITEVVTTEQEERFFRDELGNTAGNSFDSQVAKASKYVQHAALSNMDEAILYLQGGPGFGASPPISGISLASKSSWASEALSSGFKRVILMDQRGTGRSNPITKQTLQARFPDLFAFDNVEDAQGGGKSVPNTLCSLEEKGLSIEVIRFKIALKNAEEFMSNFRADNIVRDAESIRKALLLATEHEVQRPWGAALGQSYGGFCMMTYLSQIPHPPKICLFTGGIAPMLTPVQEVYGSLWDRVRDRNLRYYDAYPGDVALVKQIVRRLLDHQQPVLLPSGGILTARRFLQLGLGLGGSPGAFASLHYLLASAFTHTIGGEGGGEFTRAFLKDMDSRQPFDDHPIYFLLHESIYGDGSSSSPTQWAAHTTFEGRNKTPSEFSYEITARINSDEQPTLFFGEMVFPWMADGDYAELSGLGMKSLAHALADKKDWGSLYDETKMKLAFGNTKAAAAVYFDDMYVDFDACMKVVKRGGPLEKCKVWITNDYQHSGLRDDGANIFVKLLGMAKGSVGTPS